MKLAHVALYVQDLEGMKAFYTAHFAARANEGYHNPQTGLRSYFLQFDGGVSLELMHRPQLVAAGESGPRVGYAHLAFGTGSKAEVDRLTQRLQQAGCVLQSGPRTTGDGYYESCLLDPEGNQIELTV